jgi:TetR/AcrR family transcriptional repressor of nem operon
VLWSRGYGATSIQDLVDALAVERGSLYGAFGDKRRFYLEAVRLYWEVYERHLIATLDTSPLLPALREILTHPARLDELISDVGVPQGCLVGNTTAELVPQDGEATQIVTHAYRRFTDIVTDALGHAQAAGEVTDKATPRPRPRCCSIWSRASRSCRGQDSTGPRPWRRSTRRWTGCGPSAPTCPGPSPGQLD